MTELLERVIEQLKILPADEQDAIATRFLAEIEDEKSWKARFSKTTDARNYCWRPQLRNFFMIFFHH